jgi:hypothetical protein
MLIEEFQGAEHRNICKRMLIEEFLGAAHRNI